jgi:tellurite resistance protein
MTTFVFIPEQQRWLFRAGTDEMLAKSLLSDPLLFYSYYAAIGDLGKWDELVPKDDESQDDERIGTEEMLKLMSALSVKTSVKVSSEYVSVFQRAHGAYEALKGDVVKMQEHLKAQQIGYETAISVIGDGLSIERPLGALAELGGFSELDEAIVTMAFTLKVSPAFRVFVELAFEDKRRARALLPIMLACSEGELATALAEDSALVRSGLLPTPGYGRKLLPLSDYWTDILSSRDEAVQSFLLRAFEVKESTGAVGRMQPDDANLVGALLRSSQKSPDDEPADEPQATNILLYGPANVNKKAIVAGLLDRNQMSGWTLNAKNASDADLGAICFFAQRALANSGPGQVLVIEKAPSVLSNRMLSPFWFLGIDSDDEEEMKSADEVLLLDNPVPTIWLSTASTRLSDDNLGCFLYHSEIKRASRAERKLKVEGVIAGLGLSSRIQQELSLQAGLSEQQLKNAVIVANRTAEGDTTKTEAHILQAVSRSQQALNRKEKDDLRIPVTQYRLEYLNTSGKFKAPQIIAALKKRPEGLLAFYGLSGTGKTQLAEHIAGELDKPLIMRRASEILGKYVGESEKGIAEMFAEADAENAILLLDEADTFLRDRTMANHQWEVSVVNELLQRMERFKGIFIIATNLFEQLDSAALRRFPFKLEFLPLTEEQRWSMFLTETEMAAKLDSMEPAEIQDIRDRLNGLDRLTPGDFATVKGQCLLLDEQLTAEEWLDQLTLEIEMKKKATAKRTMGFTA